MDELIETTVGGLPVVIKSTLLNLGLYKEATGKVIVRAPRQARKDAGVVVSIQNSYFGEGSSVAANVPPVHIKTTNDRTQEQRRTVLREFAFGAIAFPITGVRTEATVTIHGQQRHFVTATGDVR